LAKFTEIHLERVKILQKVLEGITFLTHNVGPQDTGDIFKVMASKVKMTDILRKCTFPAEAY